MPDLASGNSTSSRSIHLDAIRGIAALSVAAGHLRALFFVNFERVIHKSALESILFALTGLGHQAVIVFFVLSGYFISSSVVKSIQRENWHWTGYAISRMTRLYVVLAPALLLGLILDKSGLAIFGLNGAYGGLQKYQAILPNPVTDTLTLKNFVGNLLFVQKILVEPFGSNAPLWSLSYEFWYYLIFPLFIFLFLPRTSNIHRIVYLALIAITVIFIGSDISLHFLIWLMGFAVAAAVPLKIARNRLLLCFCFVAFCASLLYSRGHAATNPLATDFVIGITFSLWLYVLLQQTSKIQLPAYEGAARFLSGMSYTLYLVHFPLLTFISAWIIGTHYLWQPDFEHLAFAILISIITMIYSFVVWKYTERNTNLVRATVSRYVASRTNSS